MKYIYRIMRMLLPLIPQSIHSMEIDHIQPRHFHSAQINHVTRALRSWHHAADKQHITGGLARTFALLAQKNPNTLIHNKHALQIANQLYHHVFAPEQTEISWQTLHTIANLPGFQCNKLLSAQASCIAFQIRTINALHTLYPAFNFIPLGDLQPFGPEETNMPYARQYLAYNTNLNPYDFEDYATALLLLGAWTMPKKHVETFRFH